MNIAGTILLLIVKISSISRTYLKNKISVQGKARNGEKAEHTSSM